MVKCLECKEISESNNDIFFDVSYSDTGLDITRTDGVVCKTCIGQWIILNSWDNINLIKRIKNPTESGS